MAIYQFNPQDNSIILEVHLKGRFTQHAHLVLDTGASLLVIPWKIATSLGLRIDPNHLIDTTTASTVESSPLTTIPQVSVLGKSIKNVECIIRDLPKEAGVDGLLGLSFLKNFKLTIDFKKGFLLLE